MSYPGPPGVNSSHPSLPPRPPPGTASKPKFSSTFSSSAAPTTYGPTAPPTTSSYPSASTYSSAAPTSYGAAPTRYGASQPASSYNYPRQTPVSGGGSSSTYSQPNTSYGYGSGQGYGAQQSQTTYGASQASYGAPPQIRNPFPAPGAAAAQGQSDDYDPDMAAQIAQWQSAYIPKDQQEAAAAAAAADPRGNNRTAGVSGYPSGVTGGDNATDAAAAAAAGAAAAGGQSGERKKTVYRQGGGKQWADDSLLEWDPSHLRLFVGNLAGETTDESLLKAFSRWKSVQKAKVVRDGRTSKSRGFGFVSFSDPDDFFQAAKEMNGKYIQSHPVTVSKAKTEIRISNIKDDKRKKNDRNKKNKGGNRGGSGSGSGASTPLGYEPHLGPAGGGVVKSGQKTKGGLKLLG